MPLPADQLASGKSLARGFADGFKVWNRKLHYYLGLYFLFFLWLFAFSGLLLNHGAWSFAQFFPSRKVTNFECAVQPPTPANDLDEARDLIRQCGIQGEISWKRGPHRPRAPRLQRKPPWTCLSNPGLSPAGPRQGRAH